MKQTETVSSDKADESRTKAGSLHTQSGVLDTHPATGMVGEGSQRKKSVLRQHAEDPVQKKLQNFYN
jgi:hypothetical protein